MSIDRHDPNSPALEVSGLTVMLGDVKALDDVSFKLAKGDSVAVVGPNGAGKSTLFRVIAGTLSPQSGRISVFGAAPGGHICIAYVPQASSVDWRFPVTVFDVVMMGRTRKIGYFRKATRADRSHVYQCLEMVNMEELSGRQIGMLSGGQKQRAFIARSLAQEAEIILMDEPLTGLDIKSQNDIFTILRSLASRGVTLLVSTHDLETAAEKFPRVMLLNRKLIALGPGEEVLKPELLLTTFGGRLSVTQGDGRKVTVYDSCCDGDEPQAARGATEDILKARLPWPRK
jgi:manganese/iron transport system ATP-binding protein